MCLLRVDRSRCVLIRTFVTLSSSTERKQDGARIVVVVVGTDAHDGAGGIGTVFEFFGPAMLRALMMACVTLSWERYSIFEAL